MERCKEKCLKLNPKKFKFKLPQLKFLGHWMTKAGVAQRTEVIQGIPEPKDLSLLAHVKEDTDFQWSARHQEAFFKAKELVISAPVLRYYDMERPVVLQVMPQTMALGQHSYNQNKTEELQSVACASCSSSKTEQRYPQIVKECVAICVAFVKFDHRQSSRGLCRKAPPRLQQMMMRLQRHSFQVTYKPGKTLWITDTLSCAPCNNANDVDVSSFDGTEPKIEGCFGLCDKGRHRCGALSKWWGRIQDTSVRHSICYAINHAFKASSHAGVASNLRLAKEFMFWPGMASAIKNICSSYSICAQYPRSSPVEPMKVVPIPEGPYELLSQDLLWFEGVSYLVTVCHWSDWIECDELPDTLSTTVVKATRKHVPQFGRPKYVLTDNGLHQPHHSLPVLPKGQWEGGVRGKNCQEHAQKV